MKRWLIAVNCLAGCIPSYPEIECFKDEPCGAGRFCDHGQCVAARDRDAGAGDVAIEDDAAVGDAAIADASDCPALRDDQVHSAPAVTLPAAGGSYVDPTFGTTIIRVTDGDDVGPSQHQGADRPAFNADSTRFVGWSNGLFQVWTFDPESHAVGPPVELTNSSCDPSTGHWSRTDPDRYYCIEPAGRRLWRYDFSTALTTEMVDFGATLTGFTLTRDLSIDRSEGFFALRATYDGSEPAGFVIYYDEPANDFTVAPPDGDPDHAGVDDSGTFVAMHLIDIGLESWDPRTDSTTTAPEDSTSFGYWCGTAGFSGSRYLGGDCNGGVIVRDLANVEPWSDMFRPKTLRGTFNVDNLFSVSTFQPDRDWALIGVAQREETNPGWDPYQNEIVAVAVDGSWALRLAHHHSVVLADADLPNPAISPDGRFVLFTSNFDGIRRDIFILVIPPGCL